MTTNNQYIYYGSQTKVSEVTQFVNHLLAANETAEAQGGKTTPICIWGRHGVGKTEIVSQIAADKGYQLTYIAPAQFEEMGDLLGMPVIENERTVFRVPDWVPQQEGPGILLIDDVNRADERILRGIMQLLQNNELVSWRLPKGWQIVLTANPDGGDYSVTPMDDAMLTRMMHITMTFDVKDWAIWASQNGVDERGINFVLTYPEIVTGQRTTPRTLVQFFASITAIKNFRDELPLINMLAASCLDDKTRHAFIAFVDQNLSALISPAEIVQAKSFTSQVAEPLSAMVRKETLRVDILATLCTRLMHYLTLNKIKPSAAELKNIQAFIKLEFLPNDLRLALLQDLIKSTNAHLKKVIADVEISKLLLNKM